MRKALCKTILAVLAFSLLSPPASGQSGAACSNTSFGNGFTCIQETSNFNGGTENQSVSAALPVAVTGGDTLLVATEAAFPAFGESVGSVTDSLGNSFTAIPSSVNTHCAHYIEWFYASNVRGGVDTVTANFTGYADGGGGTVVPMEWSGVGGFDVAGLDGNTSCPYSNTVSTSSITTGNPVDLLLAFFVDTSGAESITAGSGYTLINSFLGAADHGVEAASVASSGVYSATFSLGGSVNWETNIVAFKSGSSGGGSGTPCSNSSFGNGFHCVQKASGSNGGTINSSVSADLVSNVTAGDTILVAAEAAELAAGEYVGSVTDSLGNLYAAIPTSVNTHCAHYIEWFYASHALGGSDTVTANFNGYANGGGGTVVAMEWSGVGTLDVAGTDGNTGGCPYSASPTTSSITTTNATDLLLGFFTDTSGAASIAAGSGYTLIDSLLANEDHGVEAESVSSTGSYSASFTLGGEVNWEADVVAFKAPSGSSPTLVSIQVTPATASIITETTQQFTAIGTYSDGTTQNVTSMSTWSSSLMSVATVSSGGLATAVALGQTTIEAAVGAINNSATLTVTSACSSTSFGNGFSCIQKASNFNGGTANNSVSAALPSAVTSGNTILVATEAAFPADGELVSSVADTLGNSYTAIPASVNTNCAHYIEWFYATDVLGGPDTVTANFAGYSGGGGGTVVPMEWSGVGAFDVATNDLNAEKCPWSSVVNTGTITTTNADDLILAFFVDTSGAESVTAGSGYALIDSELAAADHGVEAQSVSSTGSYSASFTLGTSVNWEGDIVAFKAGGSSGPPPTLVSIAVTPTSPSISAGTTLQFTATGTYSNGSMRNLTNTASWSSSSTGVATISSSGQADGLTPGTTTIEATSGTVNNSVTLTVTADCSNTSFGNGFTCIQKASNFDGGTSNTSVSATLPSSVTAGDTILVATEVAFPALGERLSSVTDSLGNSYSAISSSLNSVCAHSIEWFYASNVLGGVDTVTANFSGYANGGGGTVAAMEWLGVGTLDVAGLDGNSSCPYSDTVTTSTITTTNADDLILAFFVDTSGAESIATGNGYTLIDSQLAAADHGIEAESVSSTGSYSASFTLGASVNWEADVVAFKAGGSSGPPPTLVSIAVTPSSPSISAGSPLQFTAMGTYSNGTNGNLTSAVSWSSSSTGVATINSSGLADGLTPGTTTIEAALGTVNNSVTLTVTADCSNTSLGNGFTCIQKASNFNGGTSDTSVSATLPSNVTAGDTILVATEAAFPSSGEIVSSVTDSLGNSYTAIASSVNADCAHYIEWFYATNVTGGADTVTANFSGDASGGGGTVAAMEWSGVGALDVAGLDGNSSCPYSDTVTTSTITTTNADDLILAFFVDTSGAESIATGNGYTLIDSELAAADHGIEAESVSSTGSYSASFTLGASVNWEADIVAFKSSSH